MAITLQEARDMRAAWLAALKAVSTGQEYQIGTRRLTRVDAEFCEKQLRKWDAEVDRIARGGRAGARMKRAVFIDD